TCLASHASPPTIGLMHSDQRQPGSSEIRAALAGPRSTTWTLVFDGVRVSSGASKLRTLIAMGALLRPRARGRDWFKYRAESAATQRCSRPHARRATRSLRGATGGSERGKRAQPWQQDADDLGTCDVRPAPAPRV